MKRLKVAITITAGLVVSLAATFTGCTSAEYSLVMAGRLRSEEFQIETAVYAYLLEQDLWKGRPYSAVFLKGSDEEVEALRRRFPNHQPPLKASDRAGIRPNVTPVDRDTGQPATILSATASEPVGDHAEAVGTYYAGGMISGTFLFEFRKTAGQWTIQKVTGPVGSGLSNQETQEKAASL